MSQPPPVATPLFWSILLLEFRTVHVLAAHSKGTHLGAVLPNRGHPSFREDFVDLVPYYALLGFWSGIVVARVRIPPLEALYAQCLRPLLYFHNKWRM